MDALIDRYLRAVGIELARLGGGRALAPGTDPLTHAVLACYVRAHCRGDGPQKNMVGGCP